jgi:hypothetical protein
MKCGPVNTPLGSAFEIFTFFLLFFFDRDKDGKFRTDRLAQLAVAALLRFFHKRRVVTLDVEFFGQLKDIPRTILDAKCASLTPVLIDMNFADGRF